MWLNPVLNRGYWVFQAVISDIEKEVKRRKAVKPEDG